MATITAESPPAMCPPSAPPLSGKTGDDYWKRLFAGYDWTKKWIAQSNPDVIFLVYNDHALRVLDGLHPDVRDRLRRYVQPADEGYGRARFPSCMGTRICLAHFPSRPSSMNSTLRS